MKHWHALYTKPHAERRAAVALHERGWEVFLPVVRQRYASGWREGPLFPSYLFLRVDLDQVGASQVSWTPGLRRIVCIGEKPAVVPERIVETIRCRVEEVEAKGGLAPHGLKKGDVVRLKSGPFEGLHAIFDGPMEPAERVRILIQILGSANRAVVPVADLERASRVNDHSRPPRRTRGRGRPIARTN